MRDSTSPPKHHYFAIFMQNYAQLTRQRILRMNILNPRGFHSIVFRKFCTLFHKSEAKDQSEFAISNYPIHPLIV
jgi:hypothetical protein